MQSLGPAAVGHPASVLLTIRNPGGANLTGLTITTDGANAGDFTVTANPTAPVASGGSTTFTIQFATASDVTALRTAAVHIANNVPGLNPYDINLNGQSLSFTNDTDGDGMSDAVEGLLAPLGFNWQLSQPDLVSNYYAYANLAGLYSQTQYDASVQAGISAVTNAPNSYNLYTLSQVQALNVGAPLLAKDPSSGQFKLTIGVQKAANLSQPFADFPMNGPGMSTLIDGQGKLEFQFTVPDDAAFFWLEAQ